MHDKLFPYQKIGAKWLATKTRALLADEMGLGKTAQAITAADLIDAQDILVLCPAIARLNWVSEFGMFSKHGATRCAAVLTSKARPGDSYIICSYNLMTDSGICTWILSRPWDLIILDEVHYLKNRKALRTKAVFGDDGLAERTERVWAMSGTPAPNHGGELFVLLRFFKVWIKDYWSFVRRFCKFYTHQHGIQITGTKRAPELRKLLEPFTLRRRKKDVIKDLPPIIYSTYAVEPGKVDVERWYPQLDRRTLLPEELEKEIKEQNAAIDAVINITGLGDDGLKALNGIGRRCDHARRFTGLQKVDPLVELISAELDAGAYNKKVIFCYHKAVVEDLWEKLRKYNPVIIYGGTPPLKRQKREKTFQKDPECKLLIANIEAAGIAINLTAAHHVDMVECSFVPGDNAQAIMRTHRYPFHSVNARFIYLPGSSDERIQRAYKRKTKELTEIFDPHEGIQDPFAD